MRVRLRSGIELEYDERGEGEPLLLIMGIGAQMILWPEGFCDVLASRGFRVIRFDNRDVGLSSKLDHLGLPPSWKTLMPRMLLGLPIQAPYALEDMAGDAVGLLDALGIESAHVVGASMGGMIAQTMAIVYPHRMRSLTSVMSHTGKARVWTSEVRALRALLSRPPRSREDAIAAHLNLFRVVRSTAFPFDEAAVRDRAGRSFDRCYHPQGFLRQLGAIGATGDRTARLKFVRVPTLVIHGTVDPLIRPIGGELTAKAIPNARLDLIEGMGHDLPAAAWDMLSDKVAGHARAAA
jgi:pimeloyl-ACP methyl ester carboxylesterase